MNDLFKRVGIFKISRELIETVPETVIEVLKDVLVIDVKNDFITNELTYKGYSKDFDLVEDNIIPSYVALNHDCNGVMETSWHKEKEYSEEDVKSLLKEIKEEILKSKKIPNISFNDKRI